MTRLIIVSASARIKSDPKEPIPAIERFNGVFFRVLKKYIANRQLKDAEIIVVSDKLGVIRADEKIPYVQTSKSTSNWGKLEIDSMLLDDIRSKNLERLRNLTAGKNYDEIYVNVGKQYFKLIEGFDRIIKHEKMTIAQGAGLGLKAVHMKNWIIGNS